SLADWCADRWLGAWRRLGPAPPSLAAVREALHRVAEDVMKPARERANGKFGLRYTHGGFGTPFFGEDEQVRVEGVELVFDAPAGAPAMAAHPETTGTPSPTSTWSPGRRRRPPARAGTPAGSPAPSSPTASCWRPATSGPARSTSCGGAWPRSTVERPAPAPA